MNKYGNENGIKEQMLKRGTQRDIQYRIELTDLAQGEDVIISGMSGRFPDSDDMYELRDNLYNKVDLVSGDNRCWESSLPEVPQRSGKINHITKFDAGFFGVHYRQAHSMNPMTRMAIERAYEAIVDAGVNPMTLRGKKIGVFMGVCFAECENSWFFRKLDSKYFPITGCSRGMIAKRVSYWLGLKGPSMVVDTACSSSLYALEHAFKAIKEGRCESALVGGANLCLHPKLTLQFASLGVLSPDGKCKSFDESANGYVRSESVVMIYLQKAKESRRIYAKVINAKTNCDGYKEHGISYPSRELQKQLLKELYDECKVDPSTLSYFEAHATGTKVGDPEEMDAIDQVFCTNRNNPLPIGSVKSNLGNTEPASGLCSIAKVILGMECGYILPNLHFQRPRKDLTALLEGRITVVSEPTAYEGDSGLVGINNFGFGGTNSHVLLQWNTKKKSNLALQEEELTRLVCISGRTEESITAFLDDIQSKQLNVEYIGLIHEVFKQEIPGHYYRGYSVISKDGEALRSINCAVDCRRPLWYLFGETFNTSCKFNSNLFKLEQISVLADRFDDILKPKGVDIRTILNSTEVNKFENKLTSTIYTTFFNVSFCELLEHLDIVPDHVIGFGVGEVACGFADGSLSLEEAVLIAYYRGLACTESLTLTEAASSFHNKLKRLLPKPKTRTSKWFSTSISSSHWSSELSQYASADYFTNSLFGPAIVEDVIKYIPRNAVVVDILTQDNNCKMSIGVSKIELLQKNCLNAINICVSVGRLFEAGYNPQVQKLYPKVEFPVSRGTPMLSPLVKWNHTEDWFVPKFNAYTTSKNEERKIVIDVSEERWNFLEGHIIDGRNLFPGTGYLMLAWETLAAILDLKIADMCVVFENVNLIRATNVPEKGKLEFFCMVQKDNGNFEVIEGGATVATGRIYVPKDINEEITDLSLPVGREAAEELHLSKRDVYKELRLRGYNYNGLFKGIEQCDSNAVKGLLKWSSNWVVFLDTMMQMQILSPYTRNLYISTNFQRLSIDAKKHLHYIQKLGENPLVPVYVHREAKIVRSGAIEIRGPNFSFISRRKHPNEPVLQSYRFLPNVIYGFPQFTATQSMNIFMQFILENVHDITIRAVELMDEATKQDSEPLVPIISQVLDEIPLIQSKITLLSQKALKYANVVVKDKKLITESNCNLVIATNVLNRLLIQRQAIVALKEGGFILTRESQDFNKTTVDGLDILLTHSMVNEKLILLRKIVRWKHPNVIQITGALNNFEWLTTLQNAVKQYNNVILVSQNQQFSGILGLHNCLRKEPGTDAVKCVFIMDKNAPAFDPESDFYKPQLRKDMAFNVFNNGAWGTYRFLKLDKIVAIQTEHAYVDFIAKGDLSSLTWIEGPLKVDSVMTTEQIVVQVYCASISLRDVMTDSGKFSGDEMSKARTEQDCIGVGFSGKTNIGNRVMGIANGGSLSTLIVANSYLLWDIPDHWTMEEAATVPVVYSTVLYAFFIACNLEKGSSMLIHAGSGGVGQAAINVALSRGCKVFTTVGTQEKREFIKKQYPQIDGAQIGNSRDTSFEQMIMRETGGQGVDYILNSLSEEKLQASVRCLANGGTFLEIGKLKLSNSNSLALSLFQKGASFHGVTLDVLFNGDPSILKTLNKLIAKEIKSGSIKPINRTVFKHDEVEQAFRHMAIGKHIGKVLIKIKNEEKDLNILPSRVLKTALPRYFCSAVNTYVIVGGLGGVGLELADWLVLRGAKKLVLNSRNGVRNGYQSLRIKTWKKYGVFVKVSLVNVASEEGCRKLIEEANNLGPVEGIFNLAAVLKDAIIENQTVEMYQETFEPKAFATFHLDVVSREICPKLKTFVIFSSYTCGYGICGQTNYGMANSVMERICEKRRKNGYPALAIQWGAIDGVGIVADLQENHARLNLAGTLQQSLNSCFQVMDMLVRGNTDFPAIVSCMMVAEKRGVSEIASNVVDAVASLLGLRNLKSISLHSTLAELGMDSMIAVDVKHTLERNFQVFLTEEEIRHMTFSRLKEIDSEIFKKSER